MNLFISILFTISMIASLEMTEKDARAEEKHGQELQISDSSKKTTTSKTYPVYPPMPV